MGSRRGVAVVVLGAAAAYGGAQIIGADFDNAHLRATPSDGGDDGGDDGAAGEAGPVGCPHAEPPAPPPPGQVVGNIDFSVAIHAIDYGDQTGPDGGHTYQWIGFDIDNACHEPPYNEMPQCRQGIGAPK